jgi:energy-coupling factor transporter transmembrane protein EcfT
MAMALEARGFGGRGARTSYRQLRMSRAEWVVITALAALACGAVALRIAGYGVLVPGRL